MQALSDRTVLFIILAVVVITMIFAVFVKNDSGKQSFGLPFSGKKKVVDNGSKTVDAPTV